MIAKTILVPFIVAVYHLFVSSLFVFCVILADRLFVSSSQLIV